MLRTSRREFLGGVGKSAACAAVSLALANRLGFANELLAGTRERLRFGRLDPLVDLMQATAPDRLLPIAVEKLKSGTPLADLVSSAALANARAYGGTNYDGYHALMAMMPSYEMAAQMPAKIAALPVLKVLHRNARFIQSTGHSTEDELGPLGSETGDWSLVDGLRAGDLGKAEHSLAALQARSRLQAYEELQTVVRDEMNVHRVVLAWRAHDLLRLTGEDHALTMLRQSVRFCIDEDGQRARRGRGPNEIRDLLPRLMEKHGLLDREKGTRAMDGETFDRLSGVFFSGERAAAADEAATALAAGFDPEEVGRAMSLAATRLLLCDRGQTQESAGKPIGSVHGASVGVHASDAANAWRHIARVCGARHAFASLIAGAYHTAGQSGGNVDKLPHDHDAQACAKSEPTELLDEISSSIRARDQKAACAAARRYCELGHGAEKLFQALLPFAVSEDGALHAEKYFRTAQEEHASARGEHRALYLVALTRVMASHFGFPAPGVDEARRLLT